MKTTVSKTSNNEINIKKPMSETMTNDDSNELATYTIVEDDEDKTGINACNAQPIDTNADMSLVQRALNETASDMSNKRQTNTTLNIESSNMKQLNVRIIPSCPIDKYDINK